MAKWLKRIGIALATILVVLALLAGWIVYSESGARFAIARVQSALGGKLAVGGVHGSLSGPLQLGGIHYRDPAAGIDAKVASLKIDPMLFSLLRRTLHLQTLELDDVEIAITSVPPPANPAPAPPLQQLLTPPLALLLDRVHLGRTSLTVDGKPLFAADSADLGFAWTANGLFLKQFSLRAPQGRVDLTATLSSYADLRGETKIDIDWTVAPHHIVGTLTARNDGRQATFELALTQPLAAHATGTLLPQPALGWTLALDVPAFDPRRFAPADALKSLATSLKGSGDRSGGTLTGSIDANAHRVLFDPLKFSMAGSVLAIDNLHLRSPETAGTLGATARVDLGAKPLGGEAKISWDGVELPADLVGQPLATQGALNASGNAQNFAATGDLSIGPAGRPAHVGFDLNGTPQAIALRELSLKQPHGGLAAHGEIELQPQLGWKLDAKADRLDTGAFAAQWPGTLGFALSTNGNVQKDGVHAALKLEHLAGSLRQRALSGNGEITFAPPLSLDGALELASGGSRVALRGRSGTQTDATVDLAIASLGDWLPEAAGSLRGTLAVKGAWPALAVDGSVHGGKLVYAGTHVDAFDLDTHTHAVPSAPSGTLDLHATRVAAGGYAFDTLKVTASGDRGKHTVQFEGHGSPVTLALTLDGALAPAATPDWRGTLSALSIDIKDQPSWKLAAPAALSYAGAAFSLGELCLQADQPRLCVAATTRPDSSVQAKYTLQHLPLATVVRLAAPDAPLHVQGQIDGSGEIARGADGSLNGHAALTSASGSVIYPDDATQPLLAYHSFSVDAALAPASSTVNANADFDNGGQLRAHITLGAPAAGALPLAGEVAARMDDLHFVDLLTTSLASTKGKLDGQFTLAGSTAAPQLAGQLALTDFASEIPAAGIKLTDGRISLHSADGKVFDVDGTIASGSGKLAITGRAGIGATAPLALKIDGEDFVAADIPGAQVRISPALTLQRDDKRFSVSGEVGVPRANVDLAKLPGAGGVKASSDVVVVDEAAAPAAATLPIDAVVTVKLGAGEKLALDLRQGREVHLVGFGLDGNLSGQLTVQDHPGKATSGRGQIEVNGTYKAYGQDLTIEQGRLLFAGTPVENPGLDIRATRGFPDQDVTVGLQVRGTAAAPELSVFSTPAMEQSDALSYLVAGKPMSQLRGGEGDAVGSAARALGTAGGDLLAKSIGTKMGLDDVGVADNASVGGAALTIGKYLSPRLYMSYGVGLFAPGEVVTLRYKLTKHFDAEMQNGTLSSRAGINYKIEK